MASDRFERNFVIRNAENMRALWQFLKTNAKAMIEQQRFIAVRVYEWKPQASDAQRSLIWIVNQQIAEQAWIAGRRFEAEVWHEQLKRDHLPEETRKGVKKWIVLPDGSRELRMSTEDLDREEKSVYIDQCIAYAASIGVEIVIEDRHH
jgi:hypothetical protein